MKIVMIHGIAQESFTEAELHKKWVDLIHGQSPGLLDKHNVALTYYGTTLAEFTNGGGAAVKMGVDDVRFDPANNAELTFTIQALQEAARNKNITQQQVDACAIEAVGHRAVPMDTFFGRQLVGLVGALEKLSPGQGSLALRFIKQAYTYLAAPGAAKAVDALVKPQLEGEKKVVVISHSLGTVIAFKLLREMAAAKSQTEVPLLITMGSPLGLAAVQSKLRPPLKTPAGVARWDNFYDPSDVVALGRNLGDAFGKDINDDGTVDNKTSNAHGIIGYLPHPKFIKALESVL